MMKKRTRRVSRSKISLPSFYAKAIDTEKASPPRSRRNQKEKEKNFYLSDDDDDDDARGEWRSIKRAGMDVHRKKHALECVRERET